MDTIMASRFKLALMSLERDGWLEVEVLSTQLGPEILAEAFGHTDSRLSNHKKFSRTELSKLRLIGRIYAAISQVENRQVARNWLSMMNPNLGEYTPVTVMASRQMGGRTMTWVQTEIAVEKAARAFLLSIMENGRG